MPEIMEIIIDEEFKGLLPSLDEETYNELEESLLQNGCREALVLWQDVLVDGYNRYEICMKHDIPFGTVSKEFASREEALIWIISTQVSRRNLTPMQLSHYRGLHYITNKKIAGNKSGKNQYNEVGPQNEDKPKNPRTSTLLAEKYKVSKSTIERDAKVAAAISAIGEASPDAKRKILSGESNIDKRELERLSASTKTEIEAAASQIESGAYGKKAEPASPPEEQAKPIDIILAGIAPLSAALDKIAIVFDAELPKVRNKDERAVLKKSLENCIKKLQTLSDQVSQ